MPLDARVTSRFLDEHFLPTIVTGKTKRHGLTGLESPIARQHGVRQEKASSPGSKENSKRGEGADGTSNAHQVGIIRHESSLNENARESVKPRARKRLHSLGQCIADLPKVRSPSGTCRISAGSEIDLRLTVMPASSSGVRRNLAIKLHN